jgi:hypothetical protein
VGIAVAVGGTLVAVAGAVVAVDGTLVKTGGGTVAVVAGVAEVGVTGVEAPGAGVAMGDGNAAGALTQPATKKLSMIAKLAIVLSFLVLGVAINMRTPGAIALHPFEAVLSKRRGSNTSCGASLAQCREMGGQPCSNR